MNPYGNMINESFSSLICKMNRKLLCSEYQLFIKKKKQTKARKTLIQNIA